MNYFNKLAGYITLVRPKQWVKNFFIFAAIVFSKNIFDFILLKRTIVAFVCFCLISSCVYIFNDIVDVEKDRQHPKKKLRPIASGIVNIKEAIILLVIILPLTLFIAYKIDVVFALLTLAYLLNNFLYSFYLKHLVIIDVMSIALGFLLRVISGGVIIKVYISPWLLLCTLFLSLFLGFSKRRNELIILQDGAGMHRRILEAYSVQHIDSMLSIATASTVMSYSLYTFSAHGNNSMMITIPFVLYGIFRYQYVVYRKSEGGEPEETVLKDKPLMVDIFLWGVSSMIINYWLL